MTSRLTHHLEIRDSEDELAVLRDSLEYEDKILVEIPATENYFLLDKHDAEAVVEFLKNWVKSQS